MCWPEWIRPRASVCTEGPTSIHQAKYVCMLEDYHKMWLCNELKITTLCHHLQGKEIKTFLPAISCSQEQTWTFSSRVIHTVTTACNEMFQILVCYKSSSGKHFLNKTNMYFINLSLPHITVSQKSSENHKCLSYRVCRWHQQCVLSDWWYVA